MLTQAVVEFIGTFIFLSVILSQGQALPIGIALMAVIYFGGGISGGHFNPAVSVMQLVDKKVTPITAIVYIVAQVLAGLAAYLFVRKVPSLNVF